MKNNFFKLILCILLIYGPAFADQFIFKTSEIEVLEDGNLINAKNGKAISKNKDLEIDAIKFEYFKELNILKAFKGKAFIKSENLEISFNEIEINQSSSTIIARNNVEIFETEKKLLIKSKMIIYNRKNNLIQSNTKTTMEDKFKNFFSSDNFVYDLNKDILKIKNASLRDINNNNFFIDLAFLNTSTNKLFGKDVAMDLSNESFNEENQPRLKGNSIIYDGSDTEITKGVFTTCKKRDKCPPWQISASKINHDKKNQIVNYKNAWLKVYDVPVLYFPKFFHPDPTVSRKSGFLIPKINNSPNSNNFFSIPYYTVISENKDMTFTPRFYTDDKFLLQTEFRQINKHSNHMADVSFFNEKNENSKNHIFYRLNKKINFEYFEDSSLSLDFKNTSNDTYLRRNKLESKLINDYNVLENSIMLDLYSEDLSINSEFKVYENLDKDNSDRFEFVLPKIDIIKRIKNKTNLDGNFLFKSNNLIRNFDTNIFEKVNINNLIFNSNPKINKNGFYTNYDFILKNVNSDNQNSSNYKENENFYLSSLFQVNSSLPLIKEENNIQKILKPKISLKISPENNMKDISENENKLDVDNIFNLERIGANDTLEGGISLAYGGDYSIFNKDKSKETFALKLANNLRFEESNDHTQNSQLGQKTSNFFGQLSFMPNNFFSTRYNFSTKNSFEMNYDSFLTQISLNNFVTTFDYLNENNTKENNSYLLSKSKYSFNKTNSVSFSTRENKKTNLTEYYNLIYEYKNDCLAASIEYNKDYYDDRDIKPEENIFLKLTIIPFGEANSPNLKN